MGNINKRIFFILALLLFLPIVIFAAKTSQDLRSRASAPVASSPNPAPITPTCDIIRDNGSKNYTRCLKEQFNITLDGMTPKTQRQATDSADIFYRNLKIPMGYPHYAKMFKAVGLKIVVSPQQVGTGNVAGAWAYTATDGKTFTVFQAFFNKASANYQKYVLIHEAGHVIANGSQSLNNQSQNSGYFLEQQLYTGVHNAGLDNKCFKNDFTSTYPQGIIDAQTSGITERRQIHETFAESVADTILCNNAGICPSNGSGGGSISNFPKTCADTYNFVMNSVLNFPAPVCLDSNLPEFASSPLSVNLAGDGKAGSPDNPIAGYQWDFDNNGKWDTDTSASKRQTHDYPKAGTYSPKYRIIAANNVMSPICNYTYPVSVGLLPTPIPTQVVPAEVTPTPITIDPNKSYIRLNVGLEGIGATGNKNPRKRSVNFTVNIFAPDQKKIQTSNQTLFYDSSIGRYTGLAIVNITASGIYNLYLSSNGYLTTASDTTINLKAVNTVSLLNLTGGDINNDGVRNLLDWNLLKACSIFDKNRNANLCPQGSVFQQNSDMDSSGVVDQDDITLWLQEYSSKQPKVSLPPSAAGASTVTNPSNTVATTFWVSPSGSDSNSGTSDLHGKLPHLQPPS